MSSGATKSVSGTSRNPASERQAGNATLASTTSVNAGAGIV
jgi:hypothetical protein